MAFNFEKISEIADIRKNARENVRLQFVRINGVFAIDCRVYFRNKQSCEEMVASKKGVCMTSSVAASVADALASAIEELRIMSNGGDTAPEEPAPIPVHEKPDRASAQ